MSLMGLDVGTTGAKATVFNADGDVLASAYREYPLVQPRPGWMELNPELVWRLVCEAVSDAAAKSSDPVQGLAISTLGEAAVPVDARGRVLANSILGFDTRSRSLFDKWIARQDAPAIMRTTGQPPSQMFTLIKLMWIAREQPDVYTRMAGYLCFGDFLHLRMGLEPRIDFSMAARTMAFDIHAKEYCDSLCKAAGVRSDLFSPAVPTGTPIGQLSAGPANELGLPVGCVVVAGSHDQPAGALGCGVTQPHVAMDATGTVECVGIALERPVVNELMLQNNLPCYPGAVRDLYVCLAFNFTGGSLLRWMRDTMAVAEREEARRTGRNVYDVLTDKMSDQPTDLFFVPHLMMTGTPHMDPSPVGGVLGITLGTTRGQVLRAALEGVSYEMKLNLALLDEAGARVDRIRAIGGAARNDFWLQLKADMFERPIEKLAVTEAASLGMAIAAGVAVGIYEDAAETASALIRPERTFEPDPERARFYNERLAEYREIYPALASWRDATGYRT